MEKMILLVFGSAPSRDTLDLACYLSGIGRSRLKGYFLEETRYAAKPVMKTSFGFPYVETIVAGDLPESKEQMEETKERISEFLQYCEGRGILATAHRTSTSEVNGIIDESRFSDLLIIGSGISGDGRQEEQPSSLVRGILAASQCPVIVAPEIYAPIEEIVFCYDGSPSSLFAMKQFMYLLPELDHARVNIVQINKKEEIPEIERKQVMSWLSRHYDYIGFEILEGDEEKELLNYLLRKEQAMVVMGAYGRSMISRFFRQSHADVLIKSLVHPLFIAHY